MDASKCLPTPHTWGDVRLNKGKHSLSLSQKDLHVVAWVVYGQRFYTWQPSQQRVFAGCPTPQMYESHDVISVDSTL